MNNPQAKKRIGFLFGAGISIPAGIPKTQTITNQILSGNNVMHHTDGNYYFDKPLFHHMGLPDEYVPKIVDFLEIIKTEIDLYYQRIPHKLTTNYEDLYFMASQIYDYLTGEYDNPATYPLIEKISPKIAPILIGKSHEVRKQWELTQIVDEAMKYIRDVVWRMLRPKQINSLDYLNIIKDANNDKSIWGINIFTLNNDRVLETYLNSNGLSFVDGFDFHSNELRIWKPNLYDNKTINIRLLKLHGSVDWFRIRPENSDWSGEFIGIPLQLIANSVVESDGNRFHCLDHRPIILVGTHNKLLDYTGGIIENVHNIFYEQLYDLENLVICGYSFGDSGINTKIINWMYYSPDNRIIVIHDNPDKLKNGSRGAISNHWDEWLKKGKLKIVKKKIEDTNWSDVKPLLK